MTNNQIDKPYEQCARAAVTFFSLLVGLAIKHFLDHAIRSDNPVLQHNRWIYFGIGVFIFLRYVIGSTNHLWQEYVRHATVKPSHFNKETWFLIDLSFLMIFGLLGIFAFSQTTVFKMHLWLFIYSFIGVMWTAVNNLFRDPNNPWKFWGFVNGSQGVLLILSYLGHTFWPFSIICQWDIWLFLLFLGTLGLFYWDLSYQLKNLSDLPQ